MTDQHRATTTWIVRRPPTCTNGATSSARSIVTLSNPHCSALVGGQRMTHAFHHIPVMRDEVVAQFADVPAGVVIDGTLGGGGHASALLESRPDISVLGIDRDQAARDAATGRLEAFGERVRIVSGTFSTIEDVVRNQSAWINGRPIVGILLDLGVSSTQFDDATRGFSFREDAPLDMRMDTTSGPTAAELIDAISVDELRDELRNHGEGRFANAIAQSLKKRLPSSTLELVAAVEAAVPPAARRRGHVATRTFQALRVLVNHESEELRAALEATPSVLATGGAIVVISYHSGEDRVVKEFMATRAAGGCDCPMALGCVCGFVPTLRVLRNSALLPREAEVDVNSRARSARLRAAWVVQS
jgi:16S rRNA (cytosine1402-N4)-methyltransferase